MLRMQQLVARLLCNGGDVRNVAHANDTPPGTSYAQGMTDRIGEEHTMKRIAAIGAVVAAFGIAPSLAAGGNFAAEMKPQLSAQVVGVQVTRTQRAQAAVSVQRHLVQLKLARRFGELRPQIR